MSLAGGGEVLRPSPLKWLVMVALSAGFVWMGVVIMGTHPLVAWSGIVFFGLCGVVGALNLLPGASLGRGFVPSLKDSACLPTGRVGWVTPSMGTLSSRPVRRHHWRMSLSHLAPSASAFLTSYQTDRFAATVLSARSSQIAT